MCFSNPDSRSWHHVNNREKSISSFLLSFLLHPCILSHSLCLSFRSFIFNILLSTFKSFSSSHNSLFSVCDPPFSFFLWGDRESCNHREVVCKGSHWAQLCTTVWWYLLPICICKSLRILFVCLYEPGQVCWIGAKTKIKTLNPISYYSYGYYNGLLWSIF